MHTPDSSLRSRLARVILVAAMVSLVALFATAARAQTETATDTPVSTTQDDGDEQAATTTQPDDDADDADDTEPVRLPNTGGNLAALALAGITVVELGAGLMLLAGRRRRT